MNKGGNMNIYKSILIKYNEIALKGKNRYIFEDILVRNIKRKLNNSSIFKIYKDQERIYIDIIDENNFDYDDTIKKLLHIFGIYSISPIFKIDYKNDIEYLKNNVLNFMSNIYKLDNNKTFKINAKRVNKNFSYHSIDINKIIGDLVLNNFKNMKVDVHQPEILINIEIRNHINIYSQIIKGLCGMPTGVSNKSMLLLSGGIDSPVAGYLISKRGVIIDAVYFHAPPFTSERAKQKVIDLAKIISTYSTNINLHIINFTEIQTYIYDNCPHDELTIIMRRIMMNIAEILAKKNKCLSLITGESIGQVASQTHESLYCTNNATTIPVFRPLISFDKEDIISISKKIGTYDISILPYEDCCTIFVSNHPVTKPKLDKILQSEKKLVNIDEMINNCIQNEEIIKC